MSSSKKIYLYRDFAAGVYQSLESGDFLRISNKALWTELSPVALSDSPSPFPHFPV